MFIFVVLALSAYWLTQLWLGPQVVGIAVAKEELIQTVVVNGKLVLSDPVEFVSKDSGKISSVKVKQGQSVHAGQTLMTLENKTDQSLIHKAKAATAQAEAKFRKISELTQAGSEQSLRRAKDAVDNAKKLYARNRELSGKGFVSQEQSSDAVRNLAIAQSQLATAQFQAKAIRAKGSDYALAEIALSKARAYERGLHEKSGTRSIVAETDGVLLASYVAAGQKISPGKKLMLFSPVDRAQVVMQLDDKILQDLKPGQQAWLQAEGSDNQRFNAEINTITPTKDKAGNTQELTFATQPAPDFLRQDKQILLEIVVNQRADALSVSTSAIRNADSNEPWVMVSDNGRAQHRPVKLGMRAKARVEVLEGLHENELVFPALGFDVPEGKRIRLARS